MIKERYHIYLAIVIAVFQLVGIGGFILRPDLFLKLVPMNLILSSGLVLLSQAHPPKTTLYVVLMMAFCWGVEVLGVNTGWVFGAYGYSSVLGNPVFGVPLLIGVNWLLLIFTSYQFLSIWVKSKKLLVLLTALLVTVLDWIMEPVAINYGFWTWDHSEVPFYNYFCWFVVSLLVAFGLRGLKMEQYQNKVSSVYIISQFVFFTVLNLYNG